MAIAITWPSEAARLLKAAALYGLVEAQTLFGQMLLDGHGVARDQAAAANWFAIAAGAGHPPACNMLGRCSERGWGLPVDLPRAAACYRQAAEAGLDWGQYNLASLLALEGDIAGAQKWLDMVLETAPADFLAVIPVRLKADTRPFACAD